jgi:uncharacterized protein (DUF342 family)
MSIESVGSRTAQTSLISGVDLVLELECEQIELRMTEVKQELKRNIRHLPFNMTSPAWKDALKALPKAPQEKAIQRLKRVRDLKQEMIRLNQERQSIEEKLPKDGNTATISIKALVPDVDLRIENVKTKLTSPMGANCWSLDNEQLTAGPLKPSHEEKQDANA